MFYSQDSQGFTVKTTFYVHQTPVCLHRFVRPWKTRTPVCVKLGRGERTVTKVGNLLVKNKFILIVSNKILLGLTSKKRQSGLKHEVMNNCKKPAIGFTDSGYLSGCLLLWWKNIRKKVLSFQYHFAWLFCLRNCMIYATADKNMSQFKSYFD